MSPLTRPFMETIDERAKRDPEFREALDREMTDIAEEELAEIQGKK